MLRDRCVAWSRAPRRGRESAALVGTPVRESNVALGRRIDPEGNLMTSPPGSPPGPAAPAAGAPTDAPARLGSYPIEREIGRGGMGVVYLGRDPRLDRPVALKVLPADLTAGGERLARFEREARILAQLRHPNIAGIYSLEEDGGRHFLALEYVEGETLADRLVRGPLPPVEALEVARQVAAAVEAAHESGVIHRDLKPGNVKITPAGDVRVLDFGLAKEIGGAMGATNSSLSPTLTFASTQLGLVLGTAAYMSPEQARGKELDRRTDIWSFGCVLYECLTGRQAFAGETVSDVIAGVLEREPDWEAIPREVPDRVRELIARCLAKDPKQRLRDIGDARIALDEVLALRSASGRLPVARGGEAGSGPWRGARARTSPALVAALAAAAGLAAGALLVARFAPPADRALRVVSITVPGGWKMRGSAISRDGRFVTVAAIPPGGGPLAHLYARAIGSPDLHELAGTEGYQNSYLAADGRSTYVTMPTSPGSDDRRLLRVSIEGDSPPVPIAAWKPNWTTLCSLPDGTILVADGPQSFAIVPPGGTPSGSHAMQVSGATGVSRVDFTSQSLPDGRALVNVVSYDARGWHFGVGVLDPRNGRVVVVVDDGGNAVWLGSGLLAFARGRLIYATRFDPAKTTARGPQVVVWSGLRTSWDASPGNFRVTDDGALYHSPAGTNAGRAMAMLDGAGRLTALSSERRAYNGGPDVSPDGRAYVTSVVNARGLDELWIGRIGAPGLDRLTRDGEADCSSPVWTRDGAGIAYRRRAENARDGIYLADATTGATRRLLKPAARGLAYRPLTWRADGALLLVEEAPGHNRIVVLGAGASEADPSQLRPLHAGDADERGARVSPDGRWLAWIGGASGTPEVYVEAVTPAPGARPLRVTDRGAWQCQWALDRPLLWYSDTGNRLLRAAVSTRGGQLNVAAPDTIADLGALQVGAWSAADQGRVLVALRSDDETEIPHFQLVLHWVDEVKRRMRAPDASAAATR